MTALELENIGKSFGAVEVLKAIDLTVEEGEFVVFIGPSGCGKSTLLRVIAGLEEVSDGTVRIGGDVVNLTPPAKRGIAMVFQSYALYPHLSVRDKMALGLKQENQPKDVIEERINKTVEMLSLGPYVDRRPSDLSGGQRQRVAIGRAIVREPKLFLFDEPLSNLDTALRANTRIEIAELHRKLKTSMIYVTHDQTEAMTLADKIVVLRAGKIEQIGTPMELYNNPCNQFVAGFLGAPAMNFFHHTMPDVPGSVTLGIRPEHLRLVEDGPLWGKIVYVEQLGGDTNILVKITEGESLIVRLFGQHEFHIGRHIHLDYDAENVFHFDKAQNRIFV